MKKLCLSFMLIIMSCMTYAIGANKPIVYIIATGGTIAGTGNSQVATTYKAASLTAEQLIATSLPGVTEKAELKYEQLYNKDSGNILLSDWLLLANKVNEILNKPEATGIVITHGTDTLEETAYFLNLVVKSKKPVVIVGAMRPSTSLSADGPMNLYNAIAVAIDPKSIGYGVLVCMNDQIFDARNVTKTNTIRTETFKSLNTGAIGYVNMGNINYYTAPLRLNTVATPFSINNVKELPNVAIIYEYAGVNTNMLTNILKDKTLKGIVIAGVGDGNIPNYEGDFLKQARKQGIVIVRSSRVPSGEVTYNYNELDTTFDLIAGDNLNPQKSRILLMLALLKTNSIQAIQKYFYTY